MPPIVFLYFMISGDNRGCIVQLHIGGHICKQTDKAVSKAIGYHTTMYLVNQPWVQCERSSMGIKPDYQVNALWCTATKIQLQSQQINNTHNTFAITTDKHKRTTYLQSGVELQKMKFSFVIQIFNSTSTDISYQSCQPHSCL